MLQDTRTAALVTEHFGFSPIKIVDDVINAIDSITIKGVEAFEKFLLDLHSEGKFPSEVTVDDIHKGTAKLESLIQNKIDFSFDKYELYCLRNIFNIPQNLVNKGLVRLKHHERTDFSGIKGKHQAKLEFDREVTKLYDKIEVELYQRKIIKLQINKAEKIVKYLSFIRDNLSVLNEKETIQRNTGERSELVLHDSHQQNSSAVVSIKEIYQNLEPIAQTMEFLHRQLHEIMTNVESLSRRLDDDIARDKISINSSARDQFIENKSRRILQKLNLSNIMGGEEQPKSVDDMDIVSINATEVSDLNEVAKNV
ncbi:hypothetical protein KGF56_002676 [Candida oxycetoniae]|uniref:Kinetochore-associated protein MTW1 n=1 Tax=Candida oxycetoniae TaxID=497107 RepID=A0AAI9WXW0_9ASCO|nr:uncharacterized protein KGF56_002676 [Candida oxycetoniae]KAI3404484.2 hypothetical protein KGF56_002676 [Candida oxycetoniae]